MTTEMEKNSFADVSGNVWTCRITGKHVLELKEQFGFDVRSIENPTKIDELMDDDVRFLNLIGYVLLDQLESRDRTATDLFGDMEGDQIESSFWAFIHGCIFFFPSHKRDPLLAWASQVQIAQNHCGSLMTEKVNKVDVKRMVNDRIPKEFNLNN